MHKLIIGLFCLWLATCTSREIHETRQMTIQPVDLATIANGSYPGSFTYGDFTYKVEVVIRNHQFETIKIVANRTTSHALKAAGVVDKIITSQRNDVDAISGATTTSKALLKAVENALLQTP